MRVWRRSDRVAEVRLGEMAFLAEEACSPHYWPAAAAANLTTLVAAGGSPRSCGHLGR